ncbi:tRNA dihydrouridine synthase DusB [bacterium]|nr:tRNA dihydrouridine synthase DusB [bacterium]
MQAQPQRQKNSIVEILKSKVSLAPMAGITDYVLRSLIREYSKKCLLTTEMISAEFLAQNRKQDDILMLNEDHHPISYQLCGHKPWMMGDSAQRLSEFADIIDINMGCPVRKVVGGNDGSALMRNPELAYDIVQAVKEKTDKPVSVKFRLGYTAQEMNFVEFGQKMQEAGAEFITLHARTKAQMYSGHADWEKIKELKENVDIPVFANGDVKTVEDAVMCLEQSKADGVAVGRGVLGDPTLLYRIEYFLDTGKIISAPNLSEKIEIMKHHLEEEIKLRGESVAIKFFRKFYPFYISGVKNASKIRGVLMTEENYLKLLDYFEYIKNQDLLL